MWSALLPTVQVNVTVIKFTLPTQFPQTMLSYLASVSYNWEDLNRFVLAHGYSCIVCASCNMITRGIIENNKQTKQKPVPGRPLSPATARANLLCLVAENWCVFSSCVCVCVFQYSKPCWCSSVYQTSCIYKDYCVPSHSQTETLEERVWCPLADSLDFWLPFAQELQTTN